MSGPDPTPRRRRAPGERSRARVVEHAAQLATVEGLEGLSIGRLAEATGMPKSSVHTLFGSKEELQLATVDAARARFAAEVVAPILATIAPSRARLLALCDSYLSYVRRRVFPGGCFFVAAAAELGPRPGRVHDRVAAYQDEWRTLLATSAREAAAQGELGTGADPEQVAFELGAILAGANVLAVLHGDDSALARAEAAIRSRLGL